MAARRYRVTLYDAGVMQPSETKVVEAETPAEAAEQVTGEELKAAGIPGRLRAQVQSVDKPNQRSMFYR